MRDAVFKLFNELSKNNSNHVVYFEDNKRQTKTFQELSEDIDCCINRFNFLKSTRKLDSVGILGPTSYQWMVIDLACIKGGFKSIAIPEALSEEQVRNIILETKPDILLLDQSLNSKFSKVFDDIFVFNCISDEKENDFIKVEMLEGNHEQENRILEEYGIAFSSGTSEKFKTIILKFQKSEIKNSYTLKSIYATIKQIINYKFSFWSRKNNKLIVFMPFSHLQQRSFIIQALFMKLNVVISDPRNVLKHIIVEKPNIMISVPVFYEALARRIKTKIKNFTRFQKITFKTYTFFRVFSFSNKNPIKIFYSNILFKDIRKLYGGRADFFITGSARIEPEALKIFYSVGVRIFEGYGQSELSVISMNTHENFKIGSVGKASLDIKINEDSEILVKYEEDKYKHNRQALNVNDDGYIQTGDLGYIDKNGFLFLKGRKDDVIVLSNGKKVFSQEVEDKIKKLDFVHDCIVFSQDKNKLKTIITSVNKSMSNEYILKRMKEVNGQLADHEKIEHFYIAQEIFTPENGLLTSTFKVKRNSVTERFRQEEFHRIF